MRIAIALFNLGGPDGPDAVEPFLFNLFSDPAIIRVPGFVRGFLARLISRRRAPKARGIYARIGGGSPLLPNTLAQARALEEQLQDLGEVRAFPVMRYWHPMTAQAVREIAQYAPDRVVLLPLYPQFSTTTTAHSTTTTTVCRPACAAILWRRRAPMASQPATHAFALPGTSTTGNRS